MKSWNDEQTERSSVAGRVERLVFGVLIGAMVLVTLATLFRAI